MHQCCLHGARGEEIEDPDPEVRFSLNRFLPHSTANRSKAAAAAAAAAEQQKGAAVTGC
jgi:hypothetical protein